MPVAKRFKPTPVAAATANVMALPRAKQSSAAACPAPATPDGEEAAATTHDDAELREFLAPKVKRRKSGYDAPTQHKQLVGGRMRQAREEAGVSLTEAALAMGYSQPVQLSNMETGQRPVTVKALLQYSASFGPSTDFLLGLTSDPESDPVTVVQRRLATEVAEEVRQVLAKVAAVSVDLARDVRPVVSRALRLAAASMEARNALARVRALNPEFDDECRGGSGLVARLESAAELAVELLQSTTGLQAKAQGGLVGASMTQASLDEGLTLDDVQALLASSLPQSPGAQAARVAALIGDDNGDEGDADDSAS